MGYRFLANDVPSFIEAIVVYYIWSYDYTVYTTLEFYIIDHPALKNRCVLPRKIFQEIIRPVYSRVSYI
jgi:hypothetical protein